MLVAVIEDEPPVNRQLQSWIAAEYPGARIDAWYNEADAIQAVRQEDYDLITLDIELLPNKHAGYAVRHAIAEHVRVIIISGRGDEEARASMYAMKVYDYICKPYTQSEVMQKVRRALQDRPESHLKVNNTERKKWYWKGKLVRLTPTERDIVERLHSRRHDPNPVVSRDELTKLLTSGEADSVNTHISRIRRRIKDVDSSFTCIKSEYLVGYRWEELEND
ncbi:response regulator transcription factor [Variovorax sp. WS11]|uniref:response regulator transcription factor n=1 Tax=Variovorax sp. WS11 TaxID=1105204 RepID=UPI0013DD6FCA|nr:response regulator [Variovorax sp. WS11]NDZ12708.1 response regulator transcription factor [Variovorax sp. WS11]